ncbi:MAG TPA: Ppx/GppA phosphatase family protein [Candidatus Binataceae bacterium]|nr:Ppx/GppA phosphatase family protein [Candidatus Binataceae bacterium]
MITQSIKSAADDSLIPERYAYTMRLAAIDVGSNSVHMLIADVNRKGDIEVVDRAKEMVRLGRKSFITGRLTEESMELTVRSLSYFKRLLRMRRVNRMRAVATSAVREARNRSAFIERIRAETGIALQVIPGEEEARLIFRAARHALGLEGGPHLLVDVGGGSVELVLVCDGQPLWMHSVKLGVARLSEQFLIDDPPTAAQRKRLEKHLEGEIGESMRMARKAGVVDAIGTSGTINTLVAMARAARGEDIGRLHGASASADEIARINREICEVDTASRIELPGIDAKRADLMPAAGLLADYVMRRSEAAELIACTWAMREGLLLELAGVDERSASADVRRQSVEALARRFNGTNEHGQTVARLALALFDGTAAVLELPDAARELLEYAALLHDIGHSIDHDRHNRHSYYLIKNGELLGFTPNEIELIAQVARGHRKQAPSLDAPELRALGASKRKLVRGLAALIRVADALDRSHFGVIKDLAVSYRPGQVTIAVGANGDKPDLELWTCERRTELLAKLMDRRVVLEQR